MERRDRVDKWTTTASPALRLVVVVLLWTGSSTTFTHGFVQKQHHQHQRLSATNQPLQQQQQTFTTTTKTAKTTYTNRSTPLFSRKGEKSISSRRDILRSTVAAIAASAAGVATVTPANAAGDERLFKPNPLTNPVLEKIRIWEQVEADELRYGGELEQGDAGNQGKVSAYPKLLVPILQIAKELDTVQSTLVSKQGSQELTQAKDILKQSKYEKINFKKIFNAYGDNIYYSDPDRANLYLGGGATPKAEQSLAYLLRNDILTNVENLQAEIDYLLGRPEESTEDLLSYAEIANTAMKRYVQEIVPPQEREQAQQILTSSSASS